MSSDPASHAIDAASSPVPDARRSEDGGMALVKAAVESANDAIIITEAYLDAPGPRIEYVNAAFTRMTGYGIEEIVGQTPRVLQGPKTDPGLLKRLRVDLLTQESFHGETVNYRKDGAEYIVEWRITPLHDGGGKLSKWVAIQRDVTDRVRYQDERERVFNAEHAARLEGERVSRLKDEFLATLSHELRTPLNAILGWASILKSAGAEADASEVAQAVEVIERNARAQVQLIEDLLDMSRIISGKARLEIEPLSLARVIAEAVESVRHAAEAKGIAVVEATDSSASRVHGDVARLRQVFWNLLSNAIKFTPRNGRIQIRQLQTGSAGGEATVIVQDNGQGISEDFLPYIFDRFRQSDASAARRQGGLGLGLSIVKQLVELHGGTVRVTSGGAGQGATFTVTLPVGEAPVALKTAPAAAVQEQAPPAPNPVAGPDSTAPATPAPLRGDALAGILVLLVEDDADQRHLLRRILEQQGAAVRVADEAEAGLRLLRAQVPDVLISDIGLPGIDGYEFLRRVRGLPAEQGGRVPAVALTAFARAEDRQLALRAGFQTHVSKPSEASELINVIANLASLAK